MNEEDKDNINKVNEQKIDEKQSPGESTPSDDKSSETSPATGFALLPLVLSKSVIQPPLFTEISNQKVGYTLSK